MNDPILRVSGLSVHYPIVRGVLFQRTVGHNVGIEDVSFTVGRREIVGVVGESGSGKSTLLRTLLLIERPSGGTVEFGGRSLFHATPSEQNEYRRLVQVVFQNPKSSLDPALRTERSITEPLAVRREASRRSSADAVARALDEVGLETTAGDRFPDQLSGGQQQRIAIARATASPPRILYADECVSALDVSVQARVINLLLDLRDRLGFAMVFVTHDLGVVRALCDTVLVLQRGRVVEYRPAADFFSAPTHPYSRELVDAARATELEPHR